MKYFAQVLSMFLVVAGCKPGNSADSGIKSLDNFAAGKELHRNQCRASDEKYSARIDIARSVNVVHPYSLKNAAELTAAVHETLTALPERMIKSFKALQGEVVLDPNVGATCKEFMTAYGLASKTVDMESCQYATFDEKTGKVQVRIVVSPDKGVIGHNLVKSVGYVLSQVVPFLRVSEDRRFRFAKDKSLALSELQNELMRGFLLDVGTFEHQAMFESLSSRYFKVAKPAELDAFVKDKTLKGLMTGKDDILSFFEFKSQALKDEFGNWVMAHAIDSYFCNESASYDRETAGRAMFGGSMSESQRDQALKNTAKVMGDYFPFTFGVLTARLPVVMQIKQFLEAVNPGKSTNADSGSGFSLSDPASPPRDVSTRLTPEQLNQLEGFNAESFFNGRQDAWEQTVREAEAQKGNTFRDSVMEWSPLVFGGLPLVTSEAAARAGAEFLESDASADARRKYRNQMQYYRDMVPVLERYESVQGWKSDEQLHREAMGDSQRGIEPNYPAFRSLMQRKSLEQATNSYNTNWSNSSSYGVTASAGQEGADTKVGVEASAEWSNSQGGGRETSITGVDASVAAHTKWRAEQLEAQDTINRLSPPAATPTVGGAGQGGPRESMAPSSAPAATPTVVGAGGGIPQDSPSATLSARGKASKTGTNP
jgi:hypothetical protein